MRETGRAEALAYNFVLRILPVALNKRHMTIRRGDRQHSLSKHEYQHQQ